MRLVTDLLQSLKIKVTMAETSLTALEYLKREKFDVVISDMARNGVEDEGMRFLSRSIELGVNRPTIFTVGNYDPSRGTPPYAFAITNRLDDLINYVFDALERSRG